jgi:putative Mg2+ transporter-C (MgtC) family protein
MWSDELFGGTVLPLQIIAFRLVGAVLLSGLIGFEREASDHAAGLRTNMVIGLGAATFALITIHLIDLFAGRPDVIRMDPIRLVEAATAGVAFLAAGMIVLSRGRVKNLTTGAMMWLAAAIGLAVGFGFWPIAGLAALIGLLIARLLHWLSNRVGGS